MIAYGFPRGDVSIDLDLAERMGAGCLEVLPDWARLPDPRELRRRVHDRGLVLWSAHGCWGGRTIRASRVDLGDPNRSGRQESIDDLARCADWLAQAGGRMLVVHPGGLSDPGLLDERRAALAESLLALSDHVSGSELVICVENMPPGVHPGTRMADLAELLNDLARPELALTLDTGHAHIAATPAIETLSAGSFLRTTHVHDNDGRRDTHDPPGQGTLDWDGWVAALDSIGYRGPVMLECIRSIRSHPEDLNESFLARLDRLTHGGRLGATV